MVSFERKKNLCFKDVHYDGNIKIHISSRGVLTSAIFQATEIVKVDLPPRPTHPPLLHPLIYSITTRGYIELDRIRKINEKIHHHT